LFLGEGEAAVRGVVMGYEEGVRGDTNTDIRELGDIFINVMRYSFIYFFIFLFVCLNQIYAQEKLSKKSEGLIIDPIFISCWALYPDSVIRPLKIDTQYIGRVFVEAEGDTISHELKNFTFPFVKLKSKNNVNDSIEIRLNYKMGNFDFFDSIKPRIIEHLGYLRIKQTNFEGCNKVKVIFHIPIKIE
jgi:hypothetical protein